MASSRDLIAGRTIFSSVVTLSLTSAIAAAIAFAVNVLSARALGPGLRGEVAFVLQLSYFLTPLISLAGDKVVLRGNRGGGENSQSDAPVVVPGRLIHAITTVLLIALLIALFQDWRAMAGAIAGVHAWYAIRRAEAIKTSEMWTYVRPFLVYQSVILAGSASLFLLGSSDVWAWGAVYLLPLPILLVKKKSSSPQGALRRIPASMGLVLASQAQIFWLRGDRLLMPIWVTNAELGIYVVVATASEPVYWFSQALADYRLGNQDRSRDLANRLRQLMMELLKLVPIVIALMVIITLLLEPIFGVLFAPGRRLVLPLGVAIVALFVHRQVCGWILASKKPNKVALVELGTAASAALLYPTLIAAHGALGAAWASAAVYVSGVLFGLAVLKKMKE